MCECSCVCVCVCASSTFQEHNDGSKHRDEPGPHWQQSPGYHARCVCMSVCVCLCMQTVPSSSASLHESPFLKTTSHFTLHPFCPEWISLQPQSSSSAQTFWIAQYGERFNFIPIQWSAIITKWQEPLMAKLRSAYSKQLNRHNPLPLNILACWLNN